ncbi:unnamed protein product [Cladocopium goreaui]|uniref:DUF1559 domain-containing protein n=1 Tax=Cladocopium goreaui TaxID=2562237 RepID=A0A9P1BGK8_9DINO|nr:unnamed protein product [Cladocopium goreaui]
MQMHHDVKGQLPPSVLRIVVGTVRGKPVYGAGMSGWVTLFPFLEEENFYEELDLEKGPNDFENRELVARTPAVHLCPSMPDLELDPGSSSYALSTGSEYYRDYENNGAVIDALNVYDREDEEGGCKPAIEPATASGTVSVEGKPISGMVVTLQPIGTTTGPKATAAIVNGNFTFDEKARLHGGQYLVRFTVMPSSLISRLPEEASETAVPAGSVVPRKYDIDSKLTWNLTPGAENTSTFEIELRQPDP